MKFLFPLFLTSLVMLLSQCKNCPEPITKEIIVTEYQTDTLYIRDTLKITDTIFDDVPKAGVEKGKRRFKTVGYTSATINNLYFNCRNTLILDMPKDWGKAKFTVTQAQVLVYGSDDRKVTVIPTGKVCILSSTINHKGAIRKAGDIRFNVIPSPLPIIKLLVNGKEYNSTSSISKKSRFMIKISPDSDFLSAFPKDARYMISSIDVYSQRSLGAPTKIASFSGNGKDASKGISMNLFNKLKQDPPGTKIYFKINKVYRTNFQNKKVEEKFPLQYLWLGAIIR